MSVKMTRRPVFRAAQPQRLFSAREAGVVLATQTISLSSPPTYNVSGDGQRFLLVRMVETSEDRTITVVENWSAQFKDQ